MFAFVALLQLAFLLIPSTAHAFPADTNRLGVADRARIHYEKARAELSELDTIHDIVQSFDTSDQPQRPQKRSQALAPRQNSTFTIPADGKISSPQVSAANGDDIIPIHWHEGPLSLDGFFNVDLLVLDVILALATRELAHFKCNPSDCRSEVDTWLAKGYVELYVRYGNQLWLHVDLVVVGKRVLHDYYILTFKKKGDEVPGNPMLTS